MRSLASRRNQLITALALGLLVSADSRSDAQDVRVETQQQARARIENALEQAPAQEEVADPELGEINLVSRVPRPKVITLATAQTLNFTTNAFLTSGGIESDFYWNARAGAAIIPYATRNFTPRVAFTQDWFRYGRFAELDFDSQTLQTDLKYDLTRDDSWSIIGSYSLSRLCSPDNGEFYRYGFLNGSVMHLVQLRTAPVTLGFNGGSYWRHGDPSDSDRGSVYLNIAAIYNITPTIQFTGFTRPEFQHYTHDPLGSREDVNVTVGAALSWTPNQNVALAATASYIGNYSTIDDRKYDVVTPSLIFGAQFAF